MSDLTDLLYALTGISMGLHNELGCDHQEEVYHRMLRTRLEKAGYKVTTRPQLTLLDDNHRVVRKFYPDLRVHSKNLQVLLEIKADPKGIQASDLRQARSYLSISQNDEAVLVLNFGTETLGQERAYQHRAQGTGRRPV